MWIATRGLGSSVRIGAEIDQGDRRGLEAMPTEPVKFSHELLRAIDRMRKVRPQILSARNEVERAREDAARWRKNARIAQKRLLDAQLASKGRSSTTPEEDLLQLSKRARATAKGCSRCDDRLDRAERRLDGLEYRFSIREASVFHQLDMVALTAGPDDQSEYSDDTEKSSRVSANTSSSEDIHPLILKYHETVGHLKVMRERLNEFEIAHRLKWGQRREEESSVNRLIFEEEFLPDFFDSGIVLQPEREFLDEYFTTRMAMTKELLATKDKAETLRRKCLINGMDPEDADVPNALEDAIKYNLGGPIGMMYAVTHRGIHRGVCPLDLVQVPYLHAEDRLKHWLTELSKETRDKDIPELKEDAEYMPPVRSFKLYVAVPPILTSATTYRPTHVVYTSEDERDANSAPKLKVDKQRRHWTAWAGEWVERACSYSEPDLSRPTRDPFDLWDEKSPGTWE